MDNTRPTDSGRQSSVSSASLQPSSASRYSVPSLVAHVTGLIGQLGLGIPLVMSIPDLARLAAKDGEWKPLLIVAALVVVLVVPGSIRDIRAAVLGIFGRGAPSERKD